MSKNMSATLTNKNSHAPAAITTGRVREITADEMVDELNLLVDKHNRTVVEFLRCQVWLTRQWAISRRKAAQFDALLAENNRLLELAQRSQMLQDENDHLWRVIADLDATLKQRAAADDD